MIDCLKNIPASYNSKQNGNDGNNKQNVYDSPNVEAYESNDPTDDKNNREDIK